MALLEFGQLPDVCAQHVGENVYRIPHVAKTNVKWCEAEAQDVRRTEVSNNAASDECLHDAVRVGMTQRHVTPP